MPQVLGETIPRSPRDIELEVNGGGRIKLRDYDEGCAKLFALLLYEAYPDIDPDREVWHEISLRHAMAYAFGAKATGSNTRG